MRQIIRLQWIALVLALLLVSAQGYSQTYSAEISELELQAIVSTFTDETIKLDTLNSVNDINQYLSSFQPIEQTVLTHLWLQQLSYQQEIVAHHFLWVQSLVNSQAKLFSRYSDHPQKQITVVSIAEQARSVLRISHIKYLVEKIDQLWLAGELVWIDWLTGGPDNYAALANWLTLQHNDIEVIKQSFVKDANAEQWPNNQILAILIEKSPSAELFTLMWQRKVDEYTYQTIHALPNIVDDKFVVTQLVEAMNSKQLTSQALLSLAAHYPLNETAQTVIETSLSKPDQQWYALMALNNMEAPEFKKNLLLKFEQGQTGFAESATKMIKRQISESGAQQQ